MTFSVVIATYTEKRWAELVDAVESALHQSPPPHEVIVVVDHNDELLAWVAAELGDRVVVTPNRDRRGLSGARNTGAAVATGDYVAFLDDDARARPGWLASLQAALDRPGVVGAGGLAVPEWEAGSAPSWLPDEFLWVVGCHYRGHRTTSGPVRSPIGANMAYPREVISRVGGFSWQFATPPFDRCDETEFCLRLTSQLGGHIEFEPSAVVDHRVAAERNEWSYFIRRCLLEGRAKAALSVRTGVDTATGVERTYVTRTLPAGFFRYIGRGLMGRPIEFLRAANLLVGLFATAIGFIQGHLQMDPDHRRSLVTAPEWVGAGTEKAS